MAFMKLIIIIAITMAITITLITTNPLSHQESPDDDSAATLILQKKRPSRFLTENVKTRNPNAADHCHKDPDVCLHLPPELGGGGNATTCCNNKCVDLGYDDSNCGSCKNKCKFTQVCCRGECVYLAYDKRHCGECGSPCRSGEFCVYGLCSYA